MVENEYKLEDDLPLMEAINHFAKRANKEYYIYKFIEVVKQIEKRDSVFLSDLILIEKEFNCPIRDQLVKGSGFYLEHDITKKSELNRFLGERTKKDRVNKLSFNRFRNAITALY